MQGSEFQTTRQVTSERRIPTWAAGVLALLARDRPAVVTRADLRVYLQEAESNRELDPTVRELQRLGWIVPLHLKSVWAYVPAGESQTIDPYIDLRGWRAREVDATFALAGEAAAWHLGYIDRAYQGSVAVWIPEESRLPHGLRAYLKTITIGWSANEASLLGPTTKFLHSRKLDAVNWSSGLPAFGPEALVVQLAARPNSFRVWADLVPHLTQLAADCDEGRIATLLQRRSSSAWQRAAYMLSCGGRHDDGVELLGRSPHQKMAKVTLGRGTKSKWIPLFQITDQLIAPLQESTGKA